MTRARTPVDLLIIGHGSIAGYVIENLAGDSRFALRYGICRPGRTEAAKTAFGDSVSICETVDHADGPVAVALECAGHDALRTHGPALLRRGIDLLTVSNGALADVTLLVNLQDAADEGGATLRLLSGAIGAIDALIAARVGGLDSVRYTGRKPPSGWAGSAAETAVDLMKISKPAIHFEGSAREAALRYPKNANVAATVALAGLGLDRTEARLIADPTIGGNQHQIEAKGAFGEFSFTIEGNPLPNNPKSSSLTAMSAVAALRTYVEPMSQ